MARQAKKSLAERMFVEDGMTAKAISETIGISENTLSKWRKQNRWDDRRAEMLAAPHKLREILMRELKTIAEGNTSKIDADALAKVSKVIESMSERINPQVVFSVFKEFDNWMADQDPKTALLFIEYHKQYLLYKIKQEE